MRRRKKNSNLPDPEYADGGNRYVGKTKENSLLACELCLTTGCRCVRPVTPETCPPEYPTVNEYLKYRLIDRINTCQRNHDINPFMFPDDLKKAKELEARLAKL